MRWQFGSVRGVRVGGRVPAARGRPGAPAAKDLPSEQLYNLIEDRAEARNLAPAQPDRVRALITLLDKQIAEGRSTPGPAQKNAVEVKMRKETSAEK